MNGKNLAEIRLNSKASSRRENEKIFEEILTCGDFSYRLLWNWAQMPGQIQGYEVCGTVCDKEGRLYISSRAPGHPVVVFRPDGSFERFMGENVDFGRPHGLYVEDDGSVWVTDDKYHVIYQLDPNGEQIKMLGRFKQPSDTGIVNIAHSHRLRFYTIKRLGEPFNRPTRIVRGPNGYLYASDGYGNSAIHIFDPDGVLLKTWGGMGDEPGHFGVPHSLWIDKWDRIWVADREFDRVQLFDLDGNFIKCIPNLLFPYDVVSDDNYIYISEREGRITIMDYDCNVVAQIGYYAGPCHGHSIAVDGNGNLFLGQLCGNYNVIKLERL